MENKIQNIMVVREEIQIENNLPFDVNPQVMLREEERIYCATCKNYLADYKMLGKIKETETPICSHCLAVKRVEESLKSVNLKRKARETVTEKESKTLDDVINEIFDEMK